MAVCTHFIEREIRNNFMNEEDELAFLEISCVIALAYGVNFDRTVYLQGKRALGKNKK